MKVLIVASGNADFVSPFILDQALSLEKHMIVIDYFLIKGKGVLGYIKNYNKLLEKIKIFNPDVVHAHYGLSGLLCSLQRKIPVVTTFHGSDINKPKIRFFSKIADKLSSESIFVSHGLARILKKKNPLVIPCGIDLDIFFPMDKKVARTKFGLSLEKKYLLFSSSFSNSVKNYPLAQAAVTELGDENIELIELKGYQREEVAALMNAVDAVIMTSFTEGSPQFIKEAMACNTPVVSTDVGDVKEVVGNTDGCYITSYDTIEVRNSISKALSFNNRTKGRNRIESFDNNLISKRLIDLYRAISN